MTGLNTESEGVDKMVRQEKLVEQLVTYSIFKDDKFYIIEKVPARVNPETGEQYFSPITVEKIQQIILENPKPLKVISAPVFKFS
jgi:hypothetical protein